MKTKHILLSLLFCLAIGAIAEANNIVVSGKDGKPQITGKNAVTGTADITFNLSWENSWKTREPNNWDAAWIFVKYRRSGDFWRHAHLDTLAINHKVETDKTGAGMTFSVGKSVDEDGKEFGAGVFIYRKNYGSGNIDLQDVKLRWNYRAQQVADDEVVSLRVFAVEMVYVTEGDFELGDKSGSFLPLYHSKWDNTLIDNYSWANNMGGHNGSAFPYYTSGITTYQAFTTSTGLANRMYLYSTGRYNTSLYEQWAFRSSMMARTDWSTLRSNNYWLSSSRGWTYIHIYLPDRGFRPDHFAFSPVSTSASYLAGNYRENADYISGLCVQGSKDNSTWVDLYGNYGEGETSTWKTKFRTHGNYVEYFKPEKVDFYKYFRIWVYSDIGQYAGLAWFSMNNSNGECGNWEGDESNCMNGVNRPDTTQLWYRTAAAVGSRTALHKDFPNGRKAFYMMKYELTQEAYVNFLNSLTDVQQSSRVPAALSPKQTAPSTATFTSGVRNYVRLKANLAENAEYGCWNPTNLASWDAEKNGGNLPMVGMNWMDVAAYLDWAALRPLTELEYEKACRGPLPSRPREFAWGQTVHPFVAGLEYVGMTSTTKSPKYNTTNFIVDRDGPTESTIDPNVNCVQWNGAAATTWPMRVGCFAKPKTESSPGSNRVQAGAGYYGALNLSDNANERYVNVSTSQGRAFDGSHGDGMISADGMPNQTGWPITPNAVGTGYRGGYNTTDNLYDVQPVSCRAFMQGFNESTDNNARNNTHEGCRGGRTAPVVK